MNNKETYEEILNELRQRYKHNPRIMDILNGIDDSENNKIKNILKILTNPRIMSIINIEEDIELLESIVKEDEESYNNICRLVQSVYGEDAEKIVKERPELSINDIPNFDIFDEKIRETIGYGGVHTFLTYYMRSDYIITKLARTPEMIRYYKEFEILTEGFYAPSAIGLEDKLLTWWKHRELIQSIVDSGRASEYRSNLLLMLRDEDGFSMLSKIKDEKDEEIFDPAIDLKADTLEELAAYKTTRGDVLQSYIDKASKKPGKTGDTRQIVMFKHFGIIKNSAGEYNAYNHKKFLKDYLQFNKTELTEDEVDLIEIYAMLEDIDDPEVLKKIDAYLSGRSDVVTPVQMKAIDAKVVENYKNEFVDSLITLEQARKMAEDPESESYRYICKKTGTYVFRQELNVQVMVQQNIRIMWYKRMGQKYINIKEEMVNV